MRALCLFLIAIGVAGIGAPAVAGTDRPCEVVLNGCLNASDFSGGVGYSADYGMTSVTSYGARTGAGFSSAFARASAFAAASVHTGVSGMHGSGGHR